uniref:Uncharacterized protein n=1 Tax=Odontella aurita TaxID=265563 RepID=A0A7S4JP08_9STRA|mmetsp:Transcript_50772/g.152888  ORF Transcript_50772/g.152888 Transcript_50772/m.152888 type:complete len:193 (+) Transcript_50772:42-620(+)
MHTPLFLRNIWTAIVTGVRILTSVPSNVNVLLGTWRGRILLVQVEAARLSRTLRWALWTLWRKATIVVQLLGSLQLGIGRGFIRGFIPGVKADKDPRITRPAAFVARCAAAGSAPAVNNKTDGQRLRSPEEKMPRASRPASAPPLERERHFRLPREEQRETSYATSSCPSNFRAPRLEKKRPFRLPSKELED